jgi:hypothetical protein
MINTTNALDYEKLLKILMYSQSIQNRMTLLINNITDKSHEQIDEMLAALGEPFISITKKGRNGHRYH